MTESRTAESARFARTAAQPGGPRARGLYRTRNLLLAPALVVLAIYGAALLVLFETSVHPYAPPGEPVAAGLTLGHYLKTVSDSLYFDSLIVTFKVSAIATVITLLLGYPIAYRIVRTDSAATRTVLIMLVAIPFMTNIIVRLYSLTLVLGNTGLINELAHAIGLIPERENIHLMRNQIGVTIGLVYFCLPFVVFTLTSAINRLDAALEEAAQSLGANRITTFLEVTLPLSMPGVIGATALAFILCVPAFGIPLILGGAAVRMIANTVYDQVMFVENIPLGAAFSVVALLITLAILLVQGMLTRRRHA